VGGYWSTYWYRGRIYGTEIVRGLDVLALVPSEYLSQAEIAAATIADHGGVFNPQQQFPVTWPVSPVVAQAYVDQLQRSGELSEAQLEELADVLIRSSERLETGTSDSDLANELQALSSTLTEQPGSTIGASRRSALSSTLAGIADNLR
jgi:hypothetical protein